MRRAAFVAGTIVGVLLAGGRATAAGANGDAGGPEAIEQAAIAKLARADRDRLRACFQRERALDPAIEDHMVTMVYVKPDGKVQDMHLLAAEIRGEAPRPDPPLSQKMAECLGAVVMKWTFPPTTWEGRVQLAEPLGVGGVLAVFSSKPPPTADDAKKDRDAIQAVVREHNAEMKECYDAYLDRKRSTRKPIRVLVKMTVEKSGEVSEATASEPARLDKKFKGCVLGVARKMKFAAPRSGDRTFITYPFRFESDD
jgi:hypothetical protein